MRENREKLPRTQWQGDPQNAHRKQSILHPRANQKLQRYGRVQPPQ